MSLCGSTTESSTQCIDLAWAIPIRIGLWAAQSELWLLPVIMVQVIMVSDIGYEYNLRTLS